MVVQRCYAREVTRSQNTTTQRDDARFSGKRRCGYLQKQLDGSKLEVLTEVCFAVSIAWQWVLATAMKNRLKVMTFRRRKKEGWESPYWGNWTGETRGKRVWLRKVVLVMLRLRQNAGGLTKRLCGRKLYGRRIC